MSLACLARLTRVATITNLLRHDGAVVVHEHLESPVVERA